MCLSPTAASDSSKGRRVIGCLPLSSSCRREALPLFSPSATGLHSPASALPTLASAWAPHLWHHRTAHVRTNLCPEPTTILGRAPIEGPGAPTSSPRPPGESPPPPSACASPRTPVALGATCAFSSLLPSLPARSSSALSSSATVLLVGPGRVSPSALISPPLSALVDRLARPAARGSSPSLSKPHPPPPSACPARLALTARPAPPLSAVSPPGPPGPRPSAPPPASRFRAFLTSSGPCPSPASPARLCRSWPVARVCGLPPPRCRLNLSSSVLRGWVRSASVSLTFPSWASGRSSVPCLAATTALKCPIRSLRLLYVGGPSSSGRRFCRVLSSSPTCSLLLWLSLRGGTLPPALSSAVNLAASVALATATAASPVLPSSPAAAVGAVS